MLQHEGGKKVKIKILNIYKGVRRINRVYKIILEEESLTEEAKKCIKILDFFNKYGLSATKEAFEVSKSTIQLVI